MSRPLNIAEQWGSGERWHRFIFPSTRSRNFTQALALQLARGRIILVQHGDLECRFSCPPRTGGLPTFYDEPWLNPASGYAYGRQHQPTDAPQPCVALETDLAEDDLECSGDKLAALLAQLEPSLGPDDLVLLSSTCLPSKLGDEGRIAELLRRSPVAARILYNDPDVDQSIPPVAGLVREQLERASSSEFERQPHAINLVGFPRGPAKDELLRSLASFGVSINVDLIPDIDLGELERFHRAALTVLFPEKHLDGLYENLFEGLGGRRIAPSAPYGWRATHRWCREIAAELRLDRALDEHWRRLQRSTQAERRQLEAELAGCRVCFVGARADLKSVADPSSTQGIPLFAMLAELGLEVQWLEYVGPNGGARAAKQGRTTFATPDELRRLLESCDSELIYSDIASDPRITHSGKAPISLGMFQLGTDGYRATAARLIAARRCGFYRRYREYLP